MQSNNNRERLVLRTTASCGGGATSAVRWKLLLPGFALAICAALASGNNVEVTWSVSCPPHGYGEPQPALNLDMNGDGTPDAWDAMAMIPKPGGGSYSTTDAKGNKVYVPAVPHAPDNLGGPDGHYSPRFVPTGSGADMTGEEIGRCVYPCGRNTWKLCFEDANGDCTPDEFTKSTWTSADYTTRDANGDGTPDFVDEDGDGTFDGWTEPTGDSKTFTHEFAKKKIVPAQTRRNRTVGFQIVDATIVDAGTDLSSVLLDGVPIGSPDGESPMVQEQGEAATCVNSLSATSRVLGAGQMLCACGTLVNHDVVSHSYELATFGVNLGSVQTEFDGSVVLGPGQSYTYLICGVAQSYAPAALLAYAYAETGDVGDNDMDAHVFLVGLSPGPGKELPRRRPGLDRLCTTCGDANCDGVADAFDIAPLALLFSDQAAFASAYPDCDPSCNCDVDCNGVIDSQDLSEIVIALLGTPREPPCP